MMYQYLLCGVKVEMMKETTSAIPEQQLRHFEFNREAIQHDPSFSWSEPGKEFIYQGMMYDVVQLRETGGTLTISCLNDTDEQQLTAWLFRQLQDNSSQQRHPKSLVACALDDFLTVPAFEFSNLMYVPAPPLRTVQCIPVSSESYLKLSPPPRLCFG